MHIVVEHEPFELVLIVPFAELTVLAAHKGQLLAGVADLISHEQPVAGEFLVVISEHLAEQRTLAMHHLVVRHGQNIVLAKRIHHRESEPLVLVFSVNRVGFDIVEGVVRPAHVPLEVKTEPAVRNRLCHHRPSGRLLGYHEHIRKFGEQCRVQLLEKRDRFEVLVAAVAVRNPLARLSVIIEIQHRRDRVDTQSVDMELAQPVERV